MTGTDEPEVSIVVPCFNRERLIGEAIESALAQGPHVEVIVVDDGSTDGSADVIASYPRVRTVRTPNSGPSAARNLGLRMSRGRWIRFLDSDDRLPAGSTAALLEASKHLPQRAILFGDPQLIDETGTLTSGPTYGFAGAPPGPVSTATLLSGAMSGVLPLFPLNALMEIGGFDERLTVGEDYELAVRLALDGAQFTHFPHIVYEVRDHGGARLSRHFYRAGYRALYDSFHTVWAQLERRTEQLSTKELEAIGKYVWSLGRQAARAGFEAESVRLFSLARQMAGRSAWNGRKGILLAYRVVPPYWAERLGEAIKSVVGKNREAS